MMIHGTTAIGSFELPAAAAVNRHDAREVAAYSHLLLSLLQQSDRYSCGHTPVVATRDLVPVAKEWLMILREILPGVDSSMLIRIADTYCLLHFIIYNESAADIAATYYKEAFMVRVRGDRSVSETELFRAIGSRLRAADRSFLGRHLDWYSRTLDRWFREFDKTLQASESPRLASDAETIRKANCLLGADLFAFAGRSQHIFKSEVAELCRPVLLDEKALATDSIGTMQAKLLLLRENCPRILDAEERPLVEEHLLAALSLAPALPALDRRAYLLDLSFRKQPQHNFEF